MDITLINKYGLADCLPALVTGEGPAALSKIVSAAKEVLAKVKAPKPETETVKVDGKYVAAAKADNTARLDAESYLHAVAVDVLERFADRPNVLWHLRNSDILSEVLKSECEWHAYDADRSAPKQSATEDERAELADDYRALKVLASNFLNMIADPASQTFPAGTVRKSGNDLVPDLDALKGNYGATDGSVATGKYAKAWMLTYIHDGTEYSDPKEAIRAIWPGTNRVGISTGDLYRMIDGEPWDRVNKGETVSFPEYGGREAFSVYRKATVSDAE